MPLVPSSLKKEKNALLFLHLKAMVWRRDRRGQKRNSPSDSLFEYFCKPQWICCLRACQGGRTVCNWCFWQIWIVIRYNIAVWPTDWLCTSHSACPYMPLCFCFFSTRLLMGIPGQSEVLTFSSLFSQPVSSGCLLRWAPKAGCGSVGGEMRKTKSWLSGQLAPLISPLVSSLTATLVCG